MPGLRFVKVMIPALSILLLLGCRGSEPAPASKSEAKPTAAPTGVAKTKKIRGSKVASDAYEDAHDSRGRRKAD